MVLELRAVFSRLPELCYDRALRRRPLSLSPG